MTWNNDPNEDNVIDDGGTGDDQWTRDAGNGDTHDDPTPEEYSYKTEREVAFKLIAAHALVELETSLLRAERQAAAVAPTVSALRSQAAEVVDAELLRLSTRLPDLDARARSEIARTVRRVVDKLLHEPTVRVKELASAPNGTDYADALRALFGLGIGGVDSDTATLSDAVALDPELPAGTRLSALDLRPGDADVRPGGAA